MENDTYSQEEFLTQCAKKAIQRVYDGGLRGFTTNFRGNVIEIPINGISACHYEIGLHKDCHEIALHFQSSKPAQNSARLNAFFPFAAQIKERVGYSVILGPHENVGRKRLWVKLPLQPLTPDLANQYSEILANLVMSTFSILKKTIEAEID